jgi:branched-chain amino acid transport system ATP-binding protein
VTPLLSVADLHVSYGRVEAVHGVSLDLPPSSIVSVIGANGAGKTTLLNAIMGVMPSRGAIRFNGAAIADLPLESRVGAGLSLVPEKRELFSTMSVLDNLELGGLLRARTQRTRTLDEVFARFPRLKERRGQAAGTLSGGERQMLAMGRAMMARPRVLMLDEPSLGLAPLIVRDVFTIIGDLRRDGVSILLVEQNARAALEISDYAYVMELGRIASRGPAREIAADPKLVESYLGLGGGDYNEQRLEETR